MKRKKDKKYILVEFPYPSGEGLHMGHLRPYVAADVYSRYLRMQGKDVLFPMGWDAFGLPAENYAIKNKVHPSVSVAKNISNARRQLQSWEMSFDWDREINTTEPDYYKWTQWIFLQFFKAGLAYEATGLINWCPRDKTGLANEEVIDGCCERCGTKVEKKELKQWYLKITEYAEKLLEGLKNLPEWPEDIKLQQENWIGKSEGAEIEFPLVTPQTDTDLTQTNADKKPNYVLIHGFRGSSQGVFLPWLKRELESRGYKVQTPDLPNPEKPVETEQVRHILKNVRFDENTVLLGHSLGAAVCLKVLEKIDTKIVGFVSVGGFIDHKFRDIRRPFEKTFRWQFDFEKIKSNTGFVKILSSIDDFAIPLEQGRILQKNLNGELIEAKGEESHFAGKKEPLVLENLLDLSPNLSPSPGERGVRVFTTRPDTIYGATYMVVAPEHPLIENFQFSISNFREVEKYVEEAMKKTDIQRAAVDKEKTGVELKGIKAINPATKEEIPVWAADYVMMGYGTGAIMAVPAHDERDRQFAEKYSLPIIDKPLVPIPEAIKKFGEKKIQYKLRDWVFSRQRYWGEPIPLVFCEHCAEKIKNEKSKIKTNEYSKGELENPGWIAWPENKLPVELPEIDKYEPTGTGESPLVSVKEWVNTKCPKCGGEARRETNTMPQWAGSSWYYLRYIDPKNDKEFADKKDLKKWLPVDIYFGGREHTTLHLLYSRFWHLFLYDQKLVPTPEPYAKRVPHGIILGPDGDKMSKSQGNVVNPDEIVNRYGADVLRIYEMFLGPHEATVEWEDKGIAGIVRFLEKVRRSFVTLERSDRISRDSIAHRIGGLQNDKGMGLLHKTIKKVGEDIENFRFNTAIAALMILVNNFSTSSNTKDLEIFLQLLAPFAPLTADEHWKKLGHKKSIHQESWPEYDEGLVKDKVVNIAVSVNGKHRATIKAEVKASEGEVRKLAEQDENVKKYLVGKKPRKVIYVKGKIINFVIS